MNAKWSRTCNVGSVDEKYDVWPSTSGVYIIRTGRPIQRIGGADKTGVLYIGKTRNLRIRIWKFFQSDHTASGFLWTHTEIARLVLNQDIRTTSEVKKHLGKLTVRYAEPISVKHLALAERALLFSYLACFGEAPPFNLSLPSRWDMKPESRELHWAEAGIQSRA